LTNSSPCQTGPASLDARSSSVQEARHKPGPWLEGRSWLTLSAQPRPAKRGRRQLAASEPDQAKEGGEREAEAEEGAWHQKEEEWRRQRARRWRRSRRNHDEQPTRRSGPHFSRPRTQPEPALARPMALTLANGAQEPPLTAHLRIDSLSSEDNGLYLCRVDFRKARSKIQQFELKIIGKWAPSCYSSERAARGSASNKRLTIHHEFSSRRQADNQGLELELERRSWSWRRHEAA